MRTIRVIFFIALALLLLVPSHLSSTPVWACDPNDPSTWPDLVTSFVSANNVVKITSAQTDQLSYMVGGKVIVSGTVTLTYEETDLVSSVTCGFSESVQNSSPADPSGVTITIGGNQFAVSSSGSFSATLTLPESVKTGTYNFPVTATMPTSTVETNFGAESVDGSTVTVNTNNFDVTQYMPTLTVNPTSAYPGDTVQISGDEWMPNQPVSIVFPGIGQAQASSDGSGHFNPVSLQLALDYSLYTNAGLFKGPATITGTQGNLKATVDITIKEHTLDITQVSVMPSEVWPGTEITITGKVTDHQEPNRSVSGVTVEAGCSFLVPSVPESTTTLPDGSFSLNCQEEWTPVEDKVNLYVINANLRGYGTGSEPSATFAVNKRGTICGLVSWNCGCLIATATFGSELAPEVQLLRNFRDDSIMSTHAGRQFMLLFNAWYYSFSPYVAFQISTHPAGRELMKGVLYPLIGIMALTSATYSLLQAQPEIAVLVSGLLASSLIGAFYIGIPVGLLRARISRQRWKSRALLEKALTLMIGGGILLLIVGEYFSTLLLMISTAMIVLSTVSLTATITSSRIAAKLKRL